jgi:hypothetical protein
MYKNIDYIYDAIIQLEQLSGMKFLIDSSRSEYDALISTDKYQFIIIAKPEIRETNKGIVLAQLKDFKINPNKSIIIITKFIASKIANEFKNFGINYIDVAGNAFIKKEDLLILISGQKVQQKIKTNQTRAFQDAGIKLIFNLLSNPNNLQLSYRELAERTGIAIGSVSNVMKELEEQSFILKTDTIRILKNTRQLLDRWIVAYNDFLRPKLVKKRLRFVNEERKHWGYVSLQGIEGKNFWGGEPAAAIITGHLTPSYLTIYSDINWQSLIRPLGLIPDENGDLEVLQIFWNIDKEFFSNEIVPSLLIYADLISSGKERNIEIAKEILENDLKYLWK